MPAPDPTMVFVAIDGDHAGRRVGDATLHDEAEEVTRLGHMLDRGNELFTAWAVRVGGTVINAGGDEARVTAPARTLNELPELVRRYEELTGCTVSVGVGAKLSEAAKALLVAKIHGGDQVHLYDEQTEAQIRELRPRDERAKLAEEYAVGLGKAEVHQLPANSPPPPLTAQPPAPDRADGANGGPGVPVSPAVLADPAPTELGVDPGVLDPPPPALPIQVADPVVEPTLQDRVRQLAQAGLDDEHGRVQADDAGAQALRARLAGILRKLDPKGLADLVQASPGVADTLGEVLAAVRDLARALPNSSGVRTAGAHTDPLTKGVGGAERGREHVVSPVGTIKDGAVKVQHSQPGSTLPERQGWVEARSGMIRSNDLDGHPTSARHPLEPGRDERQVA